MPASNAPAQTVAHALPDATSDCVQSSCHLAGERVREECLEFRDERRRANCKCVVDAVCRLALTAAVIVMLAQGAPASVLKTLQLLVGAQ